MGRVAPFIRENEKDALKRAKLHHAAIIRHSLATKIHLPQKLAARFMQTSPAQLSRIEKGRVDGLTFNQLFRFLARLEPNFQMLVATEAPQSPDKSPQKPPN